MNCTTWCANASLLDCVTTWAVVVLLFVVLFGGLAKEVIEWFDHRRATKSNK